MYRATLQCHSDLFWAATSASSQVIPILNKSLLTVLLQFVRGRPGQWSSAYKLEDEEAEVAAQNRSEWHRSVAQCIHLDAGKWMRVESRSLSTTASTATATATTTTTTTITMPLPLPLLKTSKPLRSLLCLLVSWSHCCMKYDRLSTIRLSVCVNFGSALTCNTVLMYPPSS